MSQSEHQRGVTAPVGAELDVFESAKDALRPEKTVQHPRLREAAALLIAGQVEIATKLLQGFVKARPSDVGALHLLALSEMRRGQMGHAQVLLERCINLAWDFIAARYSYVNLLMKLNSPQEALIQAEELLQREPHNPLFRARKATILEKMQQFAAAAESWRELISDYPSQLEPWERYGNALRAMGLFQDAAIAYRRLIALNPRSGTPWWHLADMKTFRFDAGDIEQMELKLADAGLTARDRSYLHFSLGKAYADLKLCEKSFSNYAKGNAIRRVRLTHDPDMLGAYVAHCKNRFTSDFFRLRAGSGCISSAPVFLVGMPRSGSTLVEQILASHSKIEGTNELANLMTISEELRKIALHENSDYLEKLAKLDATALKRLGDRYLEGTHAHRKLDRPFFTDKMGANYAQIGLIHLILPNAKIVDVRRQPLACCFSNFTQIFNEGQNDAYRLTDIGHNYRHYVELMAHFDRVLPGKVHRVFYENLVLEPEGEIRSLLSYLGLAFEENCLHFYKTERIITTVSAEQVRRPIYRDGLERWKDFEPWLGPLKAALGPVLEMFPDIPACD